MWFRCDWTDRNCKLIHLLDISSLKSCRQEKELHGHNEKLIETNFAVSLWTSFEKEKEMEIIASAFHVSVSISSSTTCFLKGFLLLFLRSQHEDAMHFGLLIIWVSSYQAEVQDSLEGMPQITGGAWGVAPPRLLTFHLISFKSSLGKRKVVETS